MRNERKAKKTMYWILILIILINLCTMNKSNLSEAISVGTVEKVDDKNNKDDIEFFQMLRAKTFSKTSLGLLSNAKTDNDLLLNKIKKEPTIVAKPATLNKKAKKKVTNSKTKKKSRKRKEETSVAKSVNNYSYNGNVINSISNNDIAMLERIVEAEATGGNVESKKNVASVILNRLISDQFPNTIEGVIFQRDGNVVQFAPTIDGRYYSVTVTQGTKKAVQEVLKNGDTTNGALYFCNPADIKTKWFNSLNKIFTDDIGHNFFK